MLIIGITGTLGAGKGTAVEFLTQEKNFKHFSVRGYLAEEIKKNGLPLNRDTLTSTANNLRAQHGPAYIIEELFKKASMSQQNCIIESIRTPGEITSLRKNENFYLLAIDADIKLRYQRIKLRNSETDKISFETFVSNEKREMQSEDPNKQNLSECIKQADFVIQNDGSINDLNTKVELILNKIN